MRRGAPKPAWALAVPGQQHAPQARDTMHDRHLWAQVVERGAKGSLGSSLQRSTKNAAYTRLPARAPTPHLDDEAEEVVHERVEGLVHKGAPRQVRHALEPKVDVNLRGVTAISASGGAGDGVDGDGDTGASVATEPRRLHRTWGVICTNPNLRRVQDGVDNARVQAGEMSAISAGDVPTHPPLPPSRRTRRCSPSSS